MNWRPDDWLGQPACCADCTFHPDSCYTCTGAYEFGAHAMLAALLKWLDEECQEHGNTPRVVRLEDIYGYSQAIIFPKRKDCPQCMEELKESVK